MRPLPAAEGARLEPRLLRVTVMRTSGRPGTGSLGALLLLAAVAAGCEKPLDPTDAWPTTAEQPPVVEEPSPAIVISPAYAAWCRHYCEQLEATHVYSCVSSGRGGTIETCQASAAGLADGCYDIRCLPGRVTPPTCTAQCDSLNRVYAATCSTAEPPSELCPEGARLLVQPEIAVDELEVEANGVDPPRGRFPADSEVVAADEHPRVSPRAHRAVVVSDAITRHGRRGPRDGHAVVAGLVMDRLQGPQPCVPSVGDGLRCLLRGRARTGGRHVEQNRLRETGPHRGPVALVGTDEQPSDGVDDLFLRA
jgi:hypothetical protein